jgi:hypothetical protein
MKDWEAFTQGFKPDHYRKRVAKGGKISWQANRLTDRQFNPLNDKEA